MTNEKRYLELTVEEAALRITSLPFWRGAAPELSFIAEGRTNRNFKTTFEGDTLLCRPSFDIPYHRISRGEEALCLELGALSGIAPKVRYCRDGNLIREYLPGRMLTDADFHDPAILEKVAQTFAQLHSGPWHRKVRLFDLEETDRYYLNAASPEIVDDGQRAAIRAYLDSLPEMRPFCIVHGDLIPQNYIYDGEKVFLIDWEVAGLGHPIVDFSFMALNFELSDEEIRLILEEYFAASRKLTDIIAPELTLDVVKRFVRAAAIRDGLWMIIHIQAEGILEKGDFMEYTQMALERIGLEKSYDRLYEYHEKYHRGK